MQPTETLPLLPLRGTALTPGATERLFVGRPQSRAAIEAALQSDKRFFAVTQTNVQTDKPTRADLHEVGTVVEIAENMRLPDGTLRVVVNGLSLARLVAVQEVGDYMQAQIEQVADASDTERGVPPPRAERPDDVVEESSIEGFDPEGDIAVYIERCGTINLVFESLPPSWLVVDQDQELRCLKALDQGMEKAAGVPIIWDNMNTCLIESPLPDSLAKVAQFLRAFRKEYGPAA